MKITFNHHKHMELDIKGNTQRVRRSYTVNRILSQAKVNKEVSAYHVKIDLNEPSISISSLSLVSNRKKREPELRLSAYIAGKDIIMVGCELFDGRKIVFREAQFFTKNDGCYQHIDKKDALMNDLEQAYKSANILSEL